MASCFQFYSCRVYMSYTVVSHDQASIANFKKDTTLRSTHASSGYCTGLSCL